ncbi:MAG: aminoacyl-tRNA hydrolase [Bdellovibrionales bacterium]|nr:aminoacyl-tRNA hydrolase [Bdellovibrionales bacterium]
MKLIVGLGNPGQKYETTRHNVGFLIIDQLVDEWKATGPTTKNQAEVWSATIAGEKALLIKPQTFMNLSGRSVGPFFQFHKCEPGDLIVIYDELDLKPSSYRLKTGGGTGGHNGLKSIDEALGSANNGYHRIRMGIGHPRALNLKMEPADYVLGRFSDDELAGVAQNALDVRKAIELIVAGDMKQAMNLYNRAKD